MSLLTVIALTVLCTEKAATAKANPKQECRSSATDRSPGEAMRRHWRTVRRKWGGAHRFGMFLLLLFAISPPTSLSLTGSNWPILEARGRWKENNSELLDKKMESGVSCLRVLIGLSRSVTQMTATRQLSVQTQSSDAAAQQISIWKRPKINFTSMTCIPSKIPLLPTNNVVRGNC